jgi:hypothetical protein
LNNLVLLVCGIFLLSLVSIFNNVYGITVNYTDFSVNVLDNWAFLKSNRLAEVFDRSRLELIPTEFSDLLLNPSQNLSGQRIQNGAYSIISVDSEYPYRNVPLEIHTRYSLQDLNLSKVKIFSKENTTIGGEPAVKINRSGRNNLTNIEVVEYYVVHDSKPYFLTYAANVKDFQRFLPQFELMVKTFKFAK